MTSKIEPLGGAKDDCVVNLVSFMTGLANFEEFHLGFENGEMQFYDFELEELRRRGARICNSSSPHKKLDRLGIRILAMGVTRICNRGNEPIGEETVF
jgi:hypothetical protein